MFLSKIKFALVALVAAGVLVAGIGNGSSLVQADPNKPVKPGADPVKPVGDPVKPAKPGADPVKPGDKPVNPNVKKVTGFSGMFKSFDAEKSTITVKMTKGDSSLDRTFPTAKDIKVSVDGKEAKLADLKAGIRVGVKLGDDKTTAVAIGTEGLTLIGELKEIAADQKTLKVAVKDQKGKGDERKIEEKTVKVAADTKVAVAGQKNATLADLKAGSSVSVQMSADGERAITISSPAKGRDVPGVKKPVKPGTTDPAKPVKPGSADPVKPVKNDS